MKRYVTAVPAYGRDYKSKRELLAAWNEGKDFLIQDNYLSGYISKPEWETAGKPFTLNIRYRNLRQVCVIS